MQIANLAQLQTFVAELATAFWGDDRTRDNGVRSEVREHEKRLDDVEPVAREAKACIDAHLEEHKKLEEATHTLKTAALQVRGAVIASGISALAAVAVAIITALAK